MTRVAVTTDRFDAVAPAYTSVGLEPVALPCVRVEVADARTLEQARIACTAAELVLLTSARTVDLLWRDKMMPSVAVAAVGRSTADAAALRGGRIVAVGSGGLAELVEEEATRFRSAGVVFPRAVGSDAVARRLLTGLAPSLQEFEVYRTVPLAPLSVPVDAVSFASPSAAKGWHLSRDLTGLVVGAIGRSTSATAARWREPDVVAPSPSHRALARALASHMEVI